MRSLLIGACLLTASAVGAEEMEGAPPEPGLTLTLGGGLFGFVEEEARRATDTVGPQFEIGLLLGSRRLVGLEVSYIGTGHDLEVAGVDDPNFFAHSFEGALHLNFLLGAVRPFFFAGSAVKVYVMRPTNAPILFPNDTVYEVPVGAGVAIHVSYFVLELRGAYRFAFDEELGDGFDPELDAWSSTLRVGFEL